MCAVIGQVFRFGPCLYLVVNTAPGAFMKCERLKWSQVEKRLVRTGKFLEIRKEYIRWNLLSPSQVPLYVRDVEEKYFVA